MLCSMKNCTSMSILAPFGTFTAFINLLVDLMILPISSIFLSWSFKFQASHHYCATGRLFSSIQLYSWVVFDMNYLICLQKPHVRTTQKKDRLCSTHACPINVLNLLWLVFDHEGNLHLPVTSLLYLLLTHLFGPRLKSRI